MRFSRSMASATLAAALVLAAPLTKAAHARGPEETAPSGAECRTSVDGSRVTAYCHNPYPEVDRLRLHIECARWWDLDTDGRATDARPATTVRLTGRCWKEVRAAWVSHQNRGS
ncbi:hypothetical protein AB0D49_31390 [Streptomyces sp. NPDC048290]|uniref:hypothetical protein n=1 Tax=Streptomyces sp. NPDC048290 TaxID=3155811 RepID=UPI0034310F8E